jgi:anti-sigma factor RsiW
MTDCPDGLMRDRLPEYALGVLGRDESARVGTHVSSCEACRAELALLERSRAALALGVPRMDAAAIASALPSAKGRTPASLRLSRRFTVSRHVWQYAAAAGLVMLVGGGVVWRRASQAPAAPHVDTTQVAVAPAESAAAPTTLDEGISFGGGLSDLSVDDLQALLRQMDSVRTLPSTDPESMTPVIAMNEGGKTL